jgi:hypothetical protein
VAVAVEAKPQAVITQQVALVAVVQEMRRMQVD